MGLRARGLAIAGLSFVGIAESLYMLAFDEGLLASLWCPFFGEGCEWAGDKPERAWHPVALSAIAAAAVAASAFLTYEQAAKVRAFCFWCLTTAGINAAILPTSIVLARPDGQSLHRAGRRLRTG